MAFPEQPSVPMSMTALDNDTLMQIMDLMSVHQKVKFSRLCRTIGAVTSHLLRQEKHYPSTMIERKIRIQCADDTDLAHGPLSFLSQMPNIRNFIVPQYATGNMFFGDQMAESFPLIESIETASLKIVKDYLTAMIFSDQKIRLNLIDITGDEAFDAELLIVILSLSPSLTYSCSSAAIADTQKQYESFLIDNPDAKSLFHDRLSHMTVSHAGHTRTLSFPLFSNIHSFHMEPHFDGEVMQRVLMSMPLLKDLRITAECKNLTIVCQVFKSLEIQLNIFHFLDCTNRVGNYRIKAGRPGQIDTAPLIHLIKEHGKLLTELQIRFISFEYVSRIDYGCLIHVLHDVFKPAGQKNRLTYLMIENLDFIELAYEREFLFVESWRIQSLYPLLSLFPGFRKIEIRNSSPERFDWQQQIIWFTNQRKHKKFKGEIFVRRTGRVHQKHEIKTGNLMLKIGF